MSWRGKEELRLPLKELGPNGANSLQGTIHPPVTPSDWQGPGVKASVYPLITCRFQPQIGISMGSPRVAHINITAGWLPLVCRILARETEGGQWPKSWRNISSKPQKCFNTMGWFRKGMVELGKETKWAKGTRQMCRTEPSVTPFFIPCHLTAGIHLKCSHNPGSWKLVSYHLA